MTCTECNIREASPGWTLCVPCDEALQRGGGKAPAHGTGAQAEGEAKASGEATGGKGKQAEGEGKGEQKSALAAMMEAEAEGTNDAEEMLDAIEGNGDMKPEPTDGTPDCPPECPDCGEDKSEGDDPPGEKDMQFGVNIVQCQDGSLLVEAVGGASYGQIIRLLAEAQSNIQAEITAQRCLSLLTEAQRKAQRIVDPYGQKR